MTPKKRALKKLRPTTGTRHKNQVRIIAGDWRGRKLKFAAEPGLRPTTDRVRETIFNWLAPHLAASNCLDLFAGSGALGFEAASRGASKVMMVDHSRVVCQALENAVQSLGTDAVTVLNQQALTAISGYSGLPFDIVFVDPPYACDAVSSVCKALEQHALLNEKALIYVEQSSDASKETIGPNWALLKELEAGQARGRLFRFSTTVD